MVNKKNGGKFDAHHFLQTHLKPNRNGSFKYIPHVNNNKRTNNKVNLLKQQPSINKVNIFEKQPANNKVNLLKQQSVNNKANNNKVNIVEKPVNQKVNNKQIITNLYPNNNGDLRVFLNDIVYNKVSNDGNIIVFRPISQVKLPKKEFTKNGKIKIGNKTFDICKKSVVNVTKCNEIKRRMRSNVTVSLISKRLKMNVNPFKGKKSLGLLVSILRKGKNDIKKQKGGGFGSAAKKSLKIFVGAIIWFVKLILKFLLFTLSFLCIPFMIILNIIGLRIKTCRKLADAGKSLNTDLTKGGKQKGGMKNPFKEWLYKKYPEAKEFFEYDYFPIFNINQVPKKNNTNSAIKTYADVINNCHWFMKTKVNNKTFGTSTVEIIEIVYVKDLKKLQENMIDSSKDIATGLQTLTQNLPPQDLKQIQQETDAVSQEEIANMNGEPPKT